MFRRFTCLSAAILISITITLAQNVSINNDGSPPDPSSLLDLKSTTSGLLVPRMTSTERTNILNPATGLIVFDITENSFWFFSGIKWLQLIPVERMNYLHDADDDTKVEVEQTPDDDLIRFTMEGVEYFVMDSGRIEVLNTAQSIFIGEGAGKNDDLSGDANTALGAFALHHNTDKGLNVAVGDSALFSNGLGVLDEFDGRANVAVGARALFSNTTGAHNVALGGKAMYDNTTGILNTAVGSGVLRHNTTGILNSAFGESALAQNTTGAGNTALGRWAMYWHRIGDDNTAVGLRALRSDTSGSYNVAVGAHALFWNQDISNLVAVGDSALFNNSRDAVEGMNHGVNNTAVGAKALYQNTIGDHNTAIGYRALDDNVDGRLNTALGANALTANIDGIRNTALGNAALAQNTNGEMNTAVGNGSMSFNTTGSGNTAIGNWSLISITTGDNNVAIGKEALRYDTTGYSNVAIGFEALYWNRDKSNLVAIGDSALYNNGKGALSDSLAIRNTAVGSKTLFENTIGSDNTALGSGALRYNPTGFSNTAVGALAHNNLALGDYNTVVGAEADYFNSGGQKNTIIGFQAGRNDASNGKDGNVFIGYQAGYYENGNSKLYIENSAATDPLIYGDFDSDIVGITGSVGIGTKTPERDLELEGSGDRYIQVHSTSVGGNQSGVELVRGSEFSGTDWRIANDGGVLKISDGLDNFQTAGVVNVVIDQGGKMGIGTESPTRELHIVATDPELRIEGTAPVIELEGAAILEIGYKGISKLGLDGDIIPWSSTTYDLGNNNVNEHWDDVWANDFFTYSDVNTKQNIEDLPYGLGEILQLRPVSFEYKAEVEPGQQEHFGLIAQEVQAVLPGLVVKDDIDRDPDTGELITTPGQYLGMSYSELIPVLIKGMQELSEQVTNQQNLIRSLQESNAEIRKEMTTLQNAMSNKEKH